MNNNSLLPQELQATLSSESKDFSVKAKKALPLKKSFSIIFAGIFWTLITAFIALAILQPVLQNNNDQFADAAVSVLAQPQNLKASLFPAILIGGFTVIGIFIFFAGGYSLFKKGGWFVGTPTRLITFKKGEIHSIDWEQFAGDIFVKSKNNYGDITFKMRTGRIVNKDRGPDKYIPDQIYMCGIENPAEIADLCRKRIKENDPTPTLNTKQHYE